MGRRPRSKTPFSTGTQRTHSVFRGPPVRTRLRRAHSASRAYGEGHGSKRQRLYPPLHRGKPYRNRWEVSHPQGVFRKGRRKSMQDGESLPCGMSRHPSFLYINRNLLANATCFFFKYERIKIDAKQRGFSSDCKILIRNLYTSIYIRKSPWNTQKASQREIPWEASNAFELGLQARNYLLENCGARRAALRPYFNRLSDDFP